MYRSATKSLTFLKAQNHSGKKLIHKVKNYEAQADISQRDQVAMIDMIKGVRSQIKCAYEIFLTTRKFYSLISLPLFVKNSRADKFSPSVSREKLHKIWIMIQKHGSAHQLSSFAVVTNMIKYQSDGNAVK